jgi:hypothetical protein
MVGVDFTTGTWRDPVATELALPLLDNLPGDVRLTLDTLDTYAWDGLVWKRTVKAILYRGVWDANANLPPLASGIGLRGDYYVVSVSGNTNLDGITDWVVGDWAVFNGTAWEKADHTDAVASVFGRKGSVLAQTGDYSFSQISGTIDDTQHGNRGGGTLHAVATPNPAGVAGFLSAADKTKLDKFPHWVYLPATSTYAEIQAALNDPGVDGVFLESGTYPITSDLTIPEGKLLSSGLLQPDPGVTPRAILDLTSGFKIIINKGSLQAMRVTVASASGVNATSCTMARVTLCDFQTTAGTTTKYALSGTFNQVQFVTVKNMSGVEWTGASTVPGFYNAIENLSVNGGALVNTYGFNTVAASYLVLRACFFESCYYGMAVSNASDLVVENMKVKASSRYAFQFASVTASKFTDLNAENCTGQSVLDATTLTDCVFQGIIAKTCTGLAARLINLVTVSNSYVLDVVISSCTAATHYFYATTCSNTRFNRVSNIGCTGSVSGQAAIYFLTCPSCEFRFLLVQTWTTTLSNTRGIYIASCVGSLASDIQAIGVGTNAALTCYALYFTSNTSTIFSNVLAVGCLSSNYTFWGAGQTHCEIGGLAVRSSTATTAAIFFNNWNQCTISRVSSHTNTTGVGIFFANATESCFDYLDAHGNSAIGIHIIGPNVINSSFNHIQTAKNGAIGLKVENTTGSLVSDVLSQGNTTIGIVSSGNAQCKFNSIIARANVGGNLTAGTTDSYCTWDNVHLSNPGAGTRNFTAAAATATCFYNGGFEQLGGGLANDNFPQANWITSSVVAIP